MNSTQSQIAAASISASFLQNLVKLEDFIKQAPSDELDQLFKSLSNDIQASLKEGILSIAFIGQYSAGKSTLISALTNRRDLKIDADIATDQTAIYEWHGVRLIDTPGLYTDRKDHDELTYDAIARADLLVFCLTPMLLDSITTANFQKLAYEMGYRWKMMLVINKMSDEAGEDSQKIASYTESLQVAIHPHQIQEFPLSFVDARDYCEGIDNSDLELLEFSRFDSFIAQLNQFVSERGTLAKLDTPSRICLKYLEDIEICVVRGSGKDTAFLEVLSRLTRRLEKERHRLRTQVKCITLRLMTAITNEGINLAGEVGNSNFELSCQKSEIQVRKHYEKAGEEFESLVAKAIETLKSEMLSELQSDLTQTFVARIQHDSTFNVEHVSYPSHAKQLQEQVRWLHGLAEVLGGSLSKVATKSSSILASSSGFLSSSQVAGSVLHKTVLTLGHWVGFKFKPWGAVGIAKGIGNTALFIGPAIALVAMGVELYSMQQEREFEQKMSKIRYDVNSQYQSSAQELKNQIEKQLIEVEREIYGKLERDIGKARGQIEAEIAASNAEMETLSGIRAEFVRILDSVSQNISYKEYA